MRRWVVLGVVGVAALAAVAVAAVLLGRGSPSGPDAEVEAYLAAWQRFDGQAMAKLVDRPAPDVTAAVTDMQKGLHATAATFTPRTITHHGSTADAAFTASIPVGGLDTWTYDGSLHLVRTKQGWRVQWTPGSLHPQLAAGQRFATTRTWPARAAILGDDGQPLANQADVIVVGLEPDHIKDRNQVKAVLQQTLQVDPAAVDAALAAPGVQPNFFVPVTPVDPAAFAPLRPVLEPVPGILFQRRTARRLAAGATANQTIGSVGEITADRLKQLGAPYQAGDMVGLTGLEAAFERQLAGRPSGQIRTVDPAGKTVQVLKQFDGTPPNPVATTLDLETQQAAEQALAGLAPNQPAALVAMDAGTGDVKAVVSHPLDQPFNRALDGQYPPGSTFKVVTTTALLANGTTANTVTTCPPQATVGGKPFTNFEGEAPGQIPFHQAFAISCNTAFVQLAAKLPATALPTAATAFGFGDQYPFPLPSFGGQFPRPADAAEQAAAAIGQGRVLASPLHMASVAAGVASGAWRPPRLLTSDPPTAPAEPLDPNTVTALRSLMTEVVQSPGGTGNAASEPGQAIAGKTGTAEFGSGNPPATHAWFIGFRGSLAFAVLVEGGGVGGKVAAPLAAKFLTALPA